MHYMLIEFNFTSMFPSFIKRKTSIALSIDAIRPLGNYYRTSFLLQLHCSRVSSSWLFPLKERSVLPWSEFLLYLYIDNYLTYCLTYIKKINEKFKAVEKLPFIIDLYMQVETVEVLIEELCIWHTMIKFLTDHA